MAPRIYQFIPIYIECTVNKWTVSHRSENEPSLWNRQEFANGSWYIVIYLYTCRIYPIWFLARFTFRSLLPNRITVHLFTIRYLSTNLLSFTSLAPSELFIETATRRFLPLTDREIFGRAQCYARSWNARRGQVLSWLIGTHQLYSVQETDVIGF